jgi:hypothetical protein
VDNILISERLALEMSSTEDSGLLGGYSAAIVDREFTTSSGNHFFYIENWF